jgi:hypothetical protein
VTEGGGDLANPFLEGGALGGIEGGFSLTTAP